MRRALRFSDLVNKAQQRQEDELWEDGAGEPRILCSACDQPIVPGSVAFSLQQFEVEVSDKSGRDIYQDVHMEDGSSERCYHYDCLAQHVPPFVIGADAHEV